MMEEELHKSFDNLLLNDKRNEFNLELVRLYELIKIICQENNIKKDTTDIKKYDLEKDEFMKEEEFLNMEYRNILELRNLIVNYLAWKE